MYQVLVKVSVIFLCC